MKKHFFIVMAALMTVACSEKKGISLCKSRKNQD